MIYIATYALFVDMMMTLRDTHIKSCWYFFGPLTAALLIDVLLIKFEETPCFSSLYVIGRMIGGLRVLLAFSVTMKLGKYSDWTWSTTFWPYWCSFAVMGIMAIASIIMFFSAIVNYCK